MAYCNTTTDLKQRGVYLSKNVPATLNFDFSAMVNQGAAIIDGELFNALVKVPVAVGYTNALLRLKYLNALFVNAEIEKAFSSTGAPGGSNVRTIGETFREEFWRILKTYTDNPESLFAGDDDTDAYQADYLKRASRLPWSYTDENSIEPQFTVEQDF